MLKYIIIAFTVLFTSAVYGDIMTTDKTDSPLGDALGVWHFNSITGNEDMPYETEICGDVSFARLEDQIAEAVSCGVKI